MIKFSEIYFGLAFKRKVTKIYDYVLNERISMMLVRKDMNVSEHESLSNITRTHIKQGQRKAWRIPSPKILTR